MSVRNDRGLSLVEILVTVVISGLLIGVLTQVMSIGLRDIDNTTSRVAGSNDTQLIASYFTADVASADSVSATGTTAHAAPSVTPTVTNSTLVSFWALKKATTLQLPEGMTSGWDAASQQFRIRMADEPTPAAGATGNRVATSAAGTSSITHSVALARSSTIARRGATSAVSPVAGATTLTVTKPATQANDLLLAHVAVSGGTATTVTPPAGWNPTPVASRNSGSALKSLIFQKLATNSEPATYVFSFTTTGAATPATRDAAIGVASYSGVLTTGGINQTTTEINPCGGDTPLLLLSWTDRHANPEEDVANEVAYTTRKVAGETHLIRQRCFAEGTTDMSRLVPRDQTIATNLQEGASFATCSSSSVVFATTTTVTPTASSFCSFLPVTVTMSLTEPAGRDEEGRVYTVRATTRTDRDAE